MDINNYSYTGPDFGRDDVQTEAKYDHDFGYMSLTLEQWGSDRNQKEYVVTVCGIFHDQYIDLCENFTADCSRGWETMRHSFARAAMLYNEYAPEAECIPTF